MSTDNELRKALSTLSGTTGDKLIPEIVDAGLRRFVEDRHPIYSLVNKKPWATNAYLYREVNALPSASFAADEAAVGSMTRGTYAKRSVPMKYVYSFGEVTGPEIAATGNVLDVYQTEVELHADALIRKVELTLVAGDSGSNPLEFDGLKTLITIEKDAAGAQLILSHIEEALNAPRTQPTHGFLSRAHGTRLNSLLQAQQRFVGEGEIAAGFTVETYRGVPMITVDNDEATSIGDNVLLPDMNLVTLAINEDINFTPLAKLGDSERFMLKMYLTLAVEGTAFYHSRVSNVLS